MPSCPRTVTALRRHARLRVASLALLLPASLAAQRGQGATQPTLQSRSAPIITVGRWRFRDLDRNGVLDPYEDK